MEQQQFEEFKNGYIHALLWSNIEPNTGDAFDVYGCELTTEFKERIEQDCKKFVDLAGDLVVEYLALQYPALMGHDFALTRNGHGSGFWDRSMGELGDKLTTVAESMKEINLYYDSDDDEIGCE